jgi:hypothetical protein
VDWSSIVMEIVPTTGDNVLRIFPTATSNTGTAGHCLHTSILEISTGWILFPRILLKWSQVRRICRICRVCRICRICQMTQQATLYEQDTVSSQISVSISSFCSSSTPSYETTDLSARVDVAKISIFYDGFEEGSASAKSVASSHHSS